MLDSLAGTYTLADTAVRKLSTETYAGGRIHTGITFPVGIRAVTRRILYGNPVVAQQVARTGPIATAATHDPHSYHPIL